MPSAAYMREWRSKNPDGRAKQLALTREWFRNNRERARLKCRLWKSRNNEKLRAHAAVLRAIARGILVRPSVCPQCGNEGRIEGHHEDYRKRLEVKWLCVPCHGLAHRKFKETI